MKPAEVLRRAPFGDNPTVGRRGASTQRRILIAALAVFAERGYHDAKVELITEAAGCSRPAFYQYFSSKEDLFWHLAGHLAKDMGELTEDIGSITPDEPGLQQLRGWLEALIDLSAEYDPILSGFQAAARDRRPVRKSFRAIGGRIGTALIDRAEPSPPQSDLPALGNATAGMVLRSISYWRVGLGQLTRTRFVDGLAQTVHRLLHGPIDDLNVSPASRPPPRRAPALSQSSDPTRNDGAIRSRGRRTRQKLLDAGSVALPRRGYHETRVDDIVQTAGVSHGSFYRYFANKDDLFRELARSAAASMVELIDGFPDPADAAGLREWIERWFHTYRDNGGVISAWQEIGSGDPDLANFSLDVALVVFDRLTRIIHGRGFGDSTVDAITLLAVIERVPYSVIVLRHIEEAEAVDASILILQRALFGIDV